MFDPLGAHPLRLHRVISLPRRAAACAHGGPGRSMYGTTDCEHETARLTTGINMTATAGPAGENDPCSPPPAHGGMAAGCLQIRLQINACCRRGAYYYASSCAD